MRHSLIAALALVISASVALVGCASTLTVTPTPIATVAPTTSDVAVVPDPTWQHSRTFVAAAFAGQKWGLVFGQEAKTTDNFVYVLAKDPTSTISVYVFGPTATGNVTHVLIIDSNPGFGDGRDIMDFGVMLLVNPSNNIEARARTDSEVERFTADKTTPASSSEGFGSTTLNLEAWQPGSYPTSIALTIEPAY